MNGEGVRKKKELFDEEQSVSDVSNEDLRWMMLFWRKDFQTGITSVRESVGRMEASHQTVSEQVQGNTLAVGRIQQAHDDCPLSGQEGRDNFMTNITATCLDAVKKGVEKANGAKNIFGGLNRTEIINVLVGAIVILVVAIVYLATNGKIQIPIP